MGDGLAQLLMLILIQVDAIDTASGGDAARIKVVNGLCFSHRR